MRRWRVQVATAIVIAATAGGVLVASGWSRPIMAKLTGGWTVDERIARHGSEVRTRLAPHFAAAGVTYPPGRVVLVGLKSERRVEVYAADAREAMRWIRSYPVVAASGNVGPKLREGDRQVPEGLYDVESLNPNSRFHLALRVSYPNAFDRAKGQIDGRDRLGGDIMIHGSDASVGCLAMGDEAAEDLFILVAETGIENVRVVLAPHDLRSKPRPTIADGPKWLPELYDEIDSALTVLPPPG